MDKEVVTRKLRKCSTSALLALCLFQASIAANFFLILGLCRNFSHVHGIVAIVAVVTLNVCAMVGFLDCLHGLEFVKIVLSSFCGMFYLVVCLMCGPKWRDMSAESISASVFLFLILTIPAIAHLFKLRISNFHVIVITILETFLGIAMVA